MATPRLGADGRRRLTVTITLSDLDADLLWAAAYVRYGNAAAGVSRFAKSAILTALAEPAQDPAVLRAIELLETYRAESARTDRPRLRLVK